MSGGTAWPQWTPAEDAVLREEYARGLDWEQRAHRRLPHRSVKTITGYRSKKVHCRPSAYLREHGLTPADLPCSEEAQT